ncbi:MAG: FAD-binding protein, partial [Candidatus Kapabacteria bacterium]|nr:FAD-binding protein [Candidatus Kapabacteria bacterium]
MMVQHDISLRKFNTFGVDVRTKAFCEVESTEDLRELISSGMLKEKYFIIGGGANILFTKDFDGLIIKSAIKDIAVENEIVEAGSGVVWHDFLQFLLKNSLYGGENLAKIPGTVGA